MDNVKSKSNSPENITGYGSKAHSFGYDWIYEIIKNMKRLIKMDEKSVSKDGE